MTFVMVVTTWLLLFLVCYLAVSYVFKPKDDDSQEGGEG